VLNLKKMPKTAFYIKLIHALLFVLIGICTIYVLYAAVFDRIDELTWIAFGVAVAELLILILNKGRCPLTDLAEQKGAEKGSVADLFLPEWVSVHIFTLFGMAMIISFLLLGWRLL